MRLICLALIGGLLGAGCATSKPPGASARKPSRPALLSAKSPTARTAVAPRAPAAPSLSVTNGSSVVTLTESVTGKVASVNAALRFVVLDFSLARLPAIDQRLGVYRQGVKVGEVKVSGPSYYNNIVADMVAGEVRIGDQVRPE